MDIFLGNNRLVIKVLAATADENGFKVSGYVGFARPDELINECPQVSEDFVVRVTAEGNLTLSEQATAKTAILPRCYIPRSPRAAALLHLLDGIALHAVAAIFVEKVRQGIALLAHPEAR